MVKDHGQKFVIDYLRVCLKEVVPPRCPTFLFTLDVKGSAVVICSCCVRKAIAGDFGNIEINYDS